MRKSFFRSLARACSGALTSTPCPATLEPHATGACARAHRAERQPGEIWVAMAVTVGRALLTRHATCHTRNDRAHVPDSPNDRTVHTLRTPRAYAPRLPCRALPRAPHALQAASHRPLPHTHTPPPHPRLPSTVVGGWCWWLGPGGDGRRRRRRHPSPGDARRRRQQQCSHRGRPCPGIPHASPGGGLLACCIAPTAPGQGRVFRSSLGKPPCAARADLHAASAHVTRCRGSAGARGLARATTRARGAAAAGPAANGEREW
jgi:hypothetical protein